KAGSVKTSPDPGCATDWQQPITPLLLKAEGTGTIVDTSYEKRVGHVQELANLGAKISTRNNHLAFEGPNQLTGPSVKATDLRAGAALVIAGLMAQGR
ncbi:UDP-N-acetylglucosamine 1-carboxyvinyltransferase, partial [Streptococcus suis]